MAITSNNKVDRNLIVTSKTLVSDALTSGATASLDFDLPIGASIVAAQAIVNTAVTTSGATNTFDIAFSGGDTSTVALAVAGAAGTTVDVIFANNIVTSAALTDVVLDAAGAETFTAGEVRVVVYYEFLNSLS